MSFPRFITLLLLTLLCAHSWAQERELIDVVSFFNGGYPYGDIAKRNYSETWFNQIAITSRGRTINTFVRDDLFKKDGPLESTLLYALAAPATIETFRVGGEDNDKNLTPRRFEFAISQTPTGPWEKVAAFDAPEAATRTHYDFSIPAQQKVSGRYLRVVMSGSKYGSYRLSRFSALGRFEQPVKLREDFSGFYTLNGRANQAGSPADRDMVVQQKGTAFSPYLILHQKEGQVSGCYVYADLNGGAGGKTQLREIGQVLGTLEGGVENNVFRFTRTYAADGSRSQGALALQPVGKGIVKGSYGDDTGEILIQKNPPGQAQDSVFRVRLVRFSSDPPPCAEKGQKEKTAVENMQASLEKTGKVQLYGINFDFDSDTLRPESGAVLDEVVQLARANPNWKFEVGGHTDSIGGADYNLKLSDRRAASVVRYLTGKGVDSARLRARGYGASRPLVPEDTDAARAQNRRVELVKQ